MNRRLYNNQSFILTAIYRVFVMVYLDCFVSAALILGFLGFKPIQFS